MVQEKIELSPIGVFRSSQVHPYEAGRQPDELHAEGVVELFSGKNFEQALLGLERGSRIWLLFLFHHNSHWNPMVLPPRGVNHKIGLFATRSPYRPNPLGMSCVEILEISKLRIRVAGADLLDGSPILDIKPYVAYADSFPGEEPPWLEASEKYSVNFCEIAEKQLQWLEKEGLAHLRSFLIHQLEYEPCNSKKKRVKSEGDTSIIAYRTWRARFKVQSRNISVVEIFSGYSENDLASYEDPYQDKDLHRKFSEQN